MMNKHDEQTNKTFVQINQNFFNLPVGRWNSKSCKFHEANANAILIMLF